MKYSVRFPSEAIQKKFHKALEIIPPKIKPPLFVYQCAAQYRLKIRNYRVLYDVDDKERIVWIFDVRKRNERTYG